MDLSGLWRCMVLVGMTIDLYTIAKEPKEEKGEAPVRRVISERGLPIVAIVYIAWITLLLKPEVAYWNLSRSYLRAGTEWTMTSDREVAWQSMREMKVNPAYAKHTEL